MLCRKSWLSENRRSLQKPLKRREQYSNKRSGLLDSSHILDDQRLRRCTYYPCQMPRRSLKLLLMVSEQRTKSTITLRSICNHLGLDRQLFRGKYFFRTLRQIYKLISCLSSAVWRWENICRFSIYRRVLFILGPPAPFWSTRNEQPLGSFQHTRHCHELKYCSVN